MCVCVYMCTFTLVCIHVLFASVCVCTFVHVSLCANNVCVSDNQHGCNVAQHYITLELDQAQKGEGNTDCYTSYMHKHHTHMHTHSWLPPDGIRGYNGEELGW